MAFQVTQIADGRLLLNAHPILAASGERSPAILKPLPRQQTLAKRLCDVLNGPHFSVFVRPVSIAQAEAAIEYLDRHFSGWQSLDYVTVAEFVLPAIHKLFPDRRVDGFEAEFGQRRTNGSHFARIVGCSVAIGFLLAVAFAVWFWS